MCPYVPRIAIVGGGPSGLTLGLLLHKRGIPSTIFELRPIPSAQELAKPSGMLDLHVESGLAALRECGIFDEFVALTGECAESMTIIDKQGKILWADEGTVEYRPEISRHALSNLLVSHLPAGSIHWDTKIVGATSTTTASGNTEVVLDLGAGGKETFDLVIGADGAWSKTRPLLTAVKPHYSGTHNITITLTDATKKYPHLSEWVGAGSMFTLADRKGLVSHRGAQDSIRLYLAVNTDDEDFAQTSGFAGKTAAQAKEQLLGDDGWYATWAPLHRELIAAACDEETHDNPGGTLDIKGLYMFPVDHTWAHKPGATLIGDAAHLMTPWSGEGVNLAMWDSLELSRAIAQAAETPGAETASAYESILDPLVRDFERGMFERTSKKAVKTLRNKKMMFDNENGSQAMLDFFQSIAAGFGPPPP